jgi:hypothetical protein
MRTLLTNVILVGLAAALPAQMEMRSSGQYDDVAFAAAVPAVGSPCPDLLLCDLEGRPWSLHQLLGRTVVLVKGSFT